MSATVEDATIKPHTTQPAQGEEDFSKGSEILDVTLPRELVTSLLGDGEVLWETSPYIFLEFGLSLHSI